MYLKIRLIRGFRGLKTPISAYCPQPPASEGNAPVLIIRFWKSHGGEEYKRRNELRLNAFLLMRSHHLEMV